MDTLLAHGVTVGRSDAEIAICHANRQSLAVYSRRAIADAQAEYDNIIGSAGELPIF